MRLAPGGEVGEELAQERPELEAVPRGARTHHDVADPIEHEVGIGGVVVEAAFGRCGVEAKARQQPVGRFLETAHQLGRRHELGGVGVGRRPPAVEGDLQPVTVGQP